MAVNKTINKRTNTHGAKLIIYQEHCHDMMLDPAWEIVAEDILGFILV